MAAAVGYWKIERNVSQMESVIRAEHKRASFDPLSTPKLFDN